MRSGAGGERAGNGQPAPGEKDQNTAGSANQLVAGIGQGVPGEEGLRGRGSIVKKNGPVAVREHHRRWRQGFGVLEAEAGSETQVRALDAVHPAPDVR